MGGELFLAKGFLALSHKRKYRPPPRQLFFFHLEEHPLGGNFSNFKKKLHIGTFFIDPQIFFFKISKNHNFLPKNILLGEVYFFLLFFFFFQPLRGKKKKKKKKKKK